MNTIAKGNQMTPKLHEPLESNAMGVPYFRAVEGPDKKWDWGQCPRCGIVIKNKLGAFGKHWNEASAKDWLPAR